MKANVFFHLHPGDALCANAIAQMTQMLEESVEEGKKSKKDKKKEKKEKKSVPPPPQASSAKPLNGLHPPSQVEPLHAVKRKAEHENAEGKILEENGFI